MHRSILRSLVVLATCAPAALAQIVAPVPSRSDLATPIDLQSISTLRVWKHGAWSHEPATPFGTRGCAETSSLTNASFTGGQYVVQAGFSDNESLAATYTLSPSVYPIKMTLAECIFATSNAVVNTTTEWSIEFYEGTPSTGTQIFSVSSDGTILPHLQMGVGTNGTNIQFSIDPGDPEQIIINNNGTNKFSVVWRVDRHNQPSSNPCTTAPNAQRNAFPVTDTGGLQFPNDNWLEGLNCGPFGCPPNGGWSTFAGLNVLCRPSGDWVTRVSWEPLSCQVGVGACCLPNGTCQITLIADCANLGGTYQGDNTTCETVNCPPPQGACCFSNGFCIQSEQVQCAAGGGTYLGDGTTCAPNNTCPIGACCLPTGECVGGLTSDECAAQAGTFRGVGSTCATANCPPPTGACCVNNGAACFVLTSAQCAGIPGSTWAGALTTCVDANSNGQADACEPTAPGCNDIDFNNDDLFPDDADLVDFLNVFAGGACSTGNCDSIDFNNDGLFPDDADLATYLCELGGGTNCCG